MTAYLPLSFCMPPKLSFWSLLSDIRPTTLRVILSRNVNGFNSQPPNENDEAETMISVKANPLILPIGGNRREDSEKEV